MSLVLPRKCPIKGCKHGRKIIYADKGQMRNHILHDHDYRELLESTYDLGIISDMSERRGPLWLAESLADLSLVGGGTG